MALTKPLTALLRLIRRRHERRQWPCPDLRNGSAVADGRCGFDDQLMLRIDPSSMSAQQQQQLLQMLMQQMHLQQQAAAAAAEGRG